MEPRLVPRKTIAALFLATLILGWFVAKVPLIVVLAYGVMSIFSIALYAHDKSAASNNQWRTQESTLHFIALACGWPGALFAQAVFRHKSKKAEFQTVFWTTVIINCVALACLLATGLAKAINQALLGYLVGV